MKKTIKISLGGLAFNLEEDAFLAMEKYLNSLKDYLGNSSEAKEIIGDIEVRASELFMEQLNSRETVTLEMVNSVIETLGQPEQIGGDKTAEGSTESSFGDASQAKNKRLYRDGDNAVIAGVASGLAQFFHTEPIVFRILFIALSLAKGLGVLAYIIIWIAVPIAQNARQRMEMRGEPVNLSNLEKNVKEEYEKVKNMKNKKVSSAIQNVFTGIGQLFVGLGIALGKVGKVITIIIAILLISVGLIALISTTLSVFMGSVLVSIFPAFNGFTITEIIQTTFDLGSVMWVLIPLYVVLAIPLVALIVLGLRLVFNFRIKGAALFVIATTIWIVSVTFLVLSLFFQARSFTIRESTKETIELVLEEDVINTLNVVTNPLNFEILEESERVLRVRDYHIVHHEGRTQVVGRPLLLLAQGRGENFQLKVTKTSRGATRQMARRSANGMELEYQLEGNRLSIDPYFMLKPGEKWRANEVVITLYIPNGKRVFLSQELESILGSNQDCCNFWPDEMVGKLWQMKGGELKELKKISNAK